MQLGDHGRDFLTTYFFGLGLQLHELRLDFRVLRHFNSLYHDPPGIPSLDTKVLLRNQNCYEIHQNYFV
ncbi:hypothetical protein GSH02_22060 [Burkholderia pseudomallei]|nr:hypothetical protein [Burkholderia pseudomallei]